MERYRDDVIALKPDLFILAYGLNDMRAGMKPKLFKDDMARIIRDVRASCQPVIVLVNVYHMTAFSGYPPVDKGSVTDLRVYNGVIRELADEYDCLLADVYEAQGQANWLVNPDGVHANRVGNLVIAHRIFEVLAKNCSGLSLATQGRDADTEWAHMTQKMREKGNRPLDN
jgi:lysophospholipase L1-like esterase